MLNLIPLDTLATLSTVDTAFGGSSRELHNAIAAFVASDAPMFGGRFTVGQKSTIGRSLVKLSGLTLDRKPVTKDGKPIKNKNGKTRMIDATPTADQKNEALRKLGLTLKSLADKTAVGTSEGESVLILSRV